MTKTSRNSTSTSRATEYARRFEVGGETAKWAVTMTQVRIRQALANRPFPRWHFIKFLGPAGKESRGVVDLIAIRKDHRISVNETKKGDALQIVLIQVKGGAAARPTADDGARLRAVARRHGACGVLLATWKKGHAARFFSLSLNPRQGEWSEVNDLKAVFG